MQKTAAIYARFSSDLQKDVSIDDQVALCKQIATRHGYKVGKIYSDRAKSGASMFERDGLLELMMTAKERGFNAVIVESLSRLSRDQEDTAGIFKRLHFYDIDIFDQSGEVTEIHIGVGGIVNSMFLKNLGDAVRRHHNGRAREGKIPGAVTYGYDLVPGKPGERTINEDQAKIIRRIFTEYVDGKPARHIARDLSREGIPTPSGGANWNHQTFLGGTVGSRGMIGNQLYIGKVVWNANRTVHNPDTGKRTQRRGNPDDLITTDVPHLRIIDQALWDRAHGLCDERAVTFGVAKRPQRRGNKPHLLSGLLACGVCGGNMRISHCGGDKGSRVACTSAHQWDICTHGKSYYLSELQATVLGGIKTQLTDPEALTEYTRAYHARWAERQKEASSERDSVQKVLNRVTVQIDRYITAIGESEEPVKAIMDRLKVLEAERGGLVEKLRLIEADGNVVSLHPAAIDKFAASIEQMHAALTGDLKPEAMAPFEAAFRNVFDRIVVHPTKKRHPYEVTPYARLSAIMGVELFPKVRTTEEMLAEQGLTYDGNGNTELSRIMPYHRANGPSRRDFSRPLPNNATLVVDSRGRPTRNRQ